MLGRGGVLCIALSFHRGVNFTLPRPRHVATGMKERAAQALELRANAILCTATVTRMRQCPCLLMPPGPSIEQQPCHAPIVDGLAQDGHVVGVQHAVHEADALPRRHQPRRALDDFRQQRGVLLAVLLICAAQITRVSGKSSASEKTRGWICMIRVHAKFIRADYQRSSNP